MSYRIGIYLKDEKYLSALSDFLAKKLPDAEVFPFRSLKEFSTVSEGDLRVVIISTLLNEGLWLRAMPALKKSPHILLIAFPDGPEITDDIARKYGADKLFRAPLSSNDLLASIQQILASDEKKEDEAQLPRETVESMQDLFHQIDSLDYYQLFNVTPDTDQEQIKKVYLDLARRHHPDKFRNAPPEVRRIAYEITKRVNEAYSVLSHPNRRKMYEKMKREQPDIKRFDFRLKMRYEENPHDTIHDKQARRFALLAQKAIAEGSLKQAMTQLKMANSMEPGNEYILSLMEDVQKKMQAG